MVAVIQWRLRLGDVAGGPAPGAIGAGAGAPCGSPPGGGSATLTLNAQEYVDWDDGAETFATWGTLVFSSYKDSASGETLNGTLQLEVFQTSGPGSYNAAVTWSGFEG